MIRIEEGDSRTLHLYATAILPDGDGTPHDIHYGRAHVDFAQDNSAHLHVEVFVPMRPLIKREIIRDAYRIVLGLPENIKIVAASKGQMEEIWYKFTQMLGFNEPEAVYISVNPREDLEKRMAGIVEGLRDD